MTVLSKRRVSSRFPAARPVFAAAALLVAFASARAQMMPGMPGLGGGAGVGAPTPGTGPGFLDLDAGIAYTDNARYAATNAVSDEIATAGVDVNYDRTGGPLVLSAHGNVDWTQYLHHTFSGAPFGAFNADATWGQSTSPVQWYAHEAFGESMTNPLAAPNSANLEYTNSVLTGPTLNLHFGAADRLSVYGRYGKTLYQNSPYDSSNYDGGAILAHSLSAAATLSIGVDAMQTRFSNRNIAPTYDSRSAFASYQANVRRMQLSASAGYSQVNYSGANRGTPNFALQISRSLSASTSAYLSAQSGYASQGGATGSSVASPVGGSAAIGVAAGTSSPAPFRNDLATLGWTFQRARTGLSFTASFGRQRYEPAPPGAVAPPSATYSRITNESISATLTRDLRPTLTLDLGGFLTRRRVDSLQASTTETMFRLSLTKRFRRTGLIVYATRGRQTAAGSYTGLDAGTFGANMVGIAVTYDLLRRRRAAGQ